MSVSTIETPARTQNSGARDWLQNHWDEVFASVPRGTIWAVLSRDGKQRSVLWQRLGTTAPEIGVPW